MSELTFGELIKPEGPTFLIVTALLEPAGNLKRFQPAGFPEIGHVVYDAPRGEDGVEKVCIVDSAASMANHLETVCLAGPNDPELHPDLAGLPYVQCVTDSNYTVAADGNLALSPEDNHARLVCTSLTEGHRLASDYFLDGLLNPEWKQETKKQGKKSKSGEKPTETTVAAHWEGTVFRDRLRNEFGIVEVQKNKKYFVYPENWWEIYKTIFKYDPNALVHGVLFAREQIRILRFLTAHFEALGASRVGRSGVKFDRLGKTTSGQPIFAVDEETAREIRATFILDLALLRSYGRDDKGLTPIQKQLLFELAMWKISRLVAQPFRFRSGCYLMCSSKCAASNKGSYCEKELEELLSVNIKATIRRCNFGQAQSVYYAADRLFKLEKEEPAEAAVGEETAEEAQEPEGDNEA